MENGEIIIFDEADGFIVYLPNGYDIKAESYLTPRAIVGPYYQEEFFDLEKSKEEYEFWKNVDGGALNEIIIHNISTGQEQKLSCIISLGE